MDDKADENEIYSQARLEEFIRLADFGQIILAEDVYKMARQWLIKYPG